MSKKPNSNDLSPQLSQGLTPIPDLLTGNEPKLGGDRAQCDVCGHYLSTDLFGEKHCLVCKPLVAIPRESVIRERLPGDPVWFHVSKNVPAMHIINARRGLHPFGRKLLNAGSSATCGDCEHRQNAAYHNRVFYKCNLTKWTHGPGTDLRLSWAACEGHQPRTAGKHKRVHLY